MHFGLGLDRREIETGRNRRISSEPEAALAPTVVSTGTVTDIDSTTSADLEAAYSVGPVLLQGQYIQTNFDRGAAGDISLEGYYAQIGWVVTGERHRYGDTVGVFNSPRPRGPWGAVELAARYSVLDLSEGVLRSSGEARDSTLGVNWFIGRNLRLSANYIHSEVDANDPTRDRDVDVVAARAQVDF